MVLADFACIPRPVQNYSGDGARIIVRFRRVRPVLSPFGYFGPTAGIFEDRGGIIATFVREPVFAVPDHPWLKAPDRAAVRIAMTVAQAGEADGLLGEVSYEADLNTDAPTVRLERRRGKITSKLTIGADFAQVTPLWANEAVSSPGVKPHGAGFIVTPEKAAQLGLGTVPGLDRHILPYRHGRDLTSRPRGVMVIDLFGLTDEEVRDRFPAVYQHLIDTVKPERENNNREYRRINWWLFGENNPVPATRVSTRRVLPRTRRPGDVATGNRDVWRSTQRIRRGRGTASRERRARSRWCGGWRGRCGTNGWRWRGIRRPGGG